MDDVAHNQPKHLSHADREHLFYRLRQDVEPPNTFHSETELEQMLLDGLNSGPGRAVNSEYWQEKKKRLTEQFGRRTCGT